MTVTGFCHVCFTTITLEHRLRIGLCMVCPNCDAILERLYFGSFSKEYPWAEAGKNEENFRATLPSQEKSG